MFFCKKNVSPDKMRHLQNKDTRESRNNFRKECGNVRKILRKYYASATSKQGLPGIQKFFPILCENIPGINRIVEKFRIVAL